MSRQSPLRIEDISHEPKYRGRDVGRPAVKVTFGTEETYTVASTMNLFENNNWKRKVSDGQSFLILRGHQPLTGSYQEGVESLLYNTRPRYCEIHASGFHEPSRDIKREADSFFVDLKEYAGDYDEGAMDYFASQSSNYDAADFGFRWQGKQPTEKTIRKFRSEYNIYPHNIYIYTDEYVGLQSDWQYQWERMQSLSIQYGWKLLVPFEMAEETIEELEASDEEEDG